MSMDAALTMDACKAIIPPLPVQKPKSREPEVKKFRAIVEDSRGTRYGGDHAGTLWRLDKLASRGIKWRVTSGA